MLSKFEIINSLKSKKLLKKTTVNAYLSKATNSGKINRVRRGIYISANIHDKFVIATESVKDGYVAFHSALEYHGLHTTESDCVQIAARNRFRIFHFDYNTFVRVPSISSTGIHQYYSDEGTIKCTSITKTLVDCILRTDLIGGVKELWNAFLVIEPGDIDYEELKQILAEINNKSLYQKVGYYFNHFKAQTGATEEFLQLCRTKCGNIVSSITNDCPGQYDNEWRAIIPSELKEDKNKIILHYITNEERKQILFISGIIEEYKKTNRQNNEETIKLFEAKGIFNWLNENWEVLHTTSVQYVIQEIDEILRTR